MKRDQTSAVYVPMRIREIVQNCLSPRKLDRSMLMDGTVQQENQLLSQELERARGLLRRSQNDCEELSSQYISVSEKVCRLQEVGEGGSWGGGAEL